MLHKPLYEYNKFEIFYLHLSITPPPVIARRSLSTPIMSSSDPLGGATHLCMHGCSPKPTLTVLHIKKDLDKGA